MSTVVTSRTASGTSSRRLTKEAAMVEIDLFNRRQRRVGVGVAEIRCVGTELDEARTVAGRLTSRQRLQHAPGR